MSEAPSPAGPLGAASFAAAALLVLGACTEPGLPAAAPPTRPIPTAASPRALDPQPAAMRVSDAQVDEVFIDPERLSKLRSAFPKIDSAVQAASAKMKVAGLAVGIVVDGELAHSATAGFRDLDARAATTADTIYRIGSVTKTFTAAAILKLRDEGKLSLDVPVTTYLPEFASLRYPTADARPITVRQLLSHTSGLPRNGKYDSERTDRDVTEAEVLAALTDLPLEFTPGIRYQYSNFGFSLLGLVVARAARQPYRAYLAKSFFEPLGMKSAGWEPGHLAKDHLAVAYRKKDDGGFAALPSYERLGASEADGGLYLSLRDLARWIGYNALAYPPRGGDDSGPLKRATLRESHSAAQGLRLSVNAPSDDEPPRWIARGSATGVGMAWHAQTTCDLDRIVQHNGLVDRYATDSGFLPDEGVGVVVLANSAPAPLGRLTHDILELLRQSGGLVKRARMPKSAPELDRAYAALVAVMNAWDDEKYRAMLTERHKQNVPLEREKKETSTYAALHGRCEGGKIIRFDGPEQARYAASCARGKLEIDLRLQGGLIAGFTGYSRDVSASPEVRTAAERGLALMSRWSDAGYTSTFAPSFMPAAEFKSTAEKLSKRFGECKVTELRERDGNRWERFALACKRGPSSELSVRLTEDGSRIDGFRIESKLRGVCEAR